MMTAPLLLGFTMVKTIVFVIIIIIIFLPQVVKIPGVKNKS